MNTLDKLKELKDIAVNEILNDDSLSRYEKLDSIISNNLWETESWIQHPFKNGPYGIAFLEKLKANPDERGYVCTIMDDIMSRDADHRGQTIYLSWYFEEDCASDYDTPEEYEEYLNSEVSILTSRGIPGYSVEITTREFLDYLWDWAITNKCCSWKYDW